MAMVDEKDLLRRASIKQIMDVSGASGPAAKPDLPPVSGTGTTVPTNGTEAAKPVESKPEYTSGAVSGGKDALADIREKTAWAETPVEDYSSYLEQMHKAKRDAAVAELETAYRRNTAELERSKGAVAAQYQAARNQTAAASEQARRNFAQYAAASGLNSGTGGQAELARNAVLQGSLGAINAQEAAAMADLELKRSEAEIEYNAAIEQARRTGEYELAAALYEEKVRLQEALTEQEIRRQKNALEQYRLGYQAQRDAVEDARYEREQALKEKEASAVAMSLTTAKELAEEGLLSDLVISTLKANGYDDAAIQALYGEETDPAKLAASIPQEDRDMLAAAFPDGVIRDPQRWQWWAERCGEEALKAAGYRYSEWDLPSSVYEALGMGRPETALARIDEMWDTLSAEQREKTLKILAGYGYEYTPAP